MVSGPCALEPISWGSGSQSPGVPHQCTSLGLSDAERHLCSFVACADHTGAAEGNMVLHRPHVSLIQAFKPGFALC